MGAGAGAGARVPAMTRTGVGRGVRMARTPRRGTQPGWGRDCGGGGGGAVRVRVGKLLISMYIYPGIFKKRMLWMCVCCGVGGWGGRERVGKALSLLFPERTSILNSYDQCF